MRFGQKIITLIMATWMRDKFNNNVLCSFKFDTKKRSFVHANQQFPNKSLFWHQLQLKQKGI